jgi:hypothetical protein
MLVKDISLQPGNGVLSRPYVKPDDHFLQAVQLAVIQESPYVSVAGEDEELAGVIATSDLLAEVSRFLGLQEPGGLIVLEKEKHQYSLGEINRIVETNDAQITQLNTSINHQTGMILITIRVNKTEVAAIIASFQRYDYKICFVAGEEQYANEIRSNYDHLMHYLKI